MKEKRNLSKPILTITKRDLERETFRCGGHGGQNVNKRETGVRFRHRPSGSVAESRTYRTQEQNERAAFERLCELKSFRTWLRVETLKRMGQMPRETPEELRARVDREVDAALQNGDILVEEF